MHDQSDATAHGLSDKIGLSVAHGHLAFASYPVLVGHYEGDAFSGSEAQLDRALGEQLTMRRRLGLYPGAIGTSCVVLDCSTKPKGAIVTGLGQVADMSAGLLRQALRHALLVFAAAESDRVRATRGMTPARLSISILAVGTAEGGVDLTTGVIALLQAGLEAKRALQQAGGVASPRFEAFEFVELYEDRALAIWNAVRRITGEQPEVAAAFTLASSVELRQGGRRRSRPGRDPNWWQPLTIRTLGADRSEQHLQFEWSNGRARAERMTVPADLDLVEPLVTRAVDHIDRDAAANSAGRILFELMLPPSLKDRSAEERNRRLILDEPSARFPWELLDDRRPWLAGVVEQKPPAVRAGLVRQLLQVTGPDQMRVPQQRTALVIGDPRALPTEGFVKLQGARDEAEAVVAALRARDYTVTRLIGDRVTPDQVCRNLFAQAWEIVHIAAHGVVDTELPGSDGLMRRVTGIVLGGGVVLGPSVLSKLPASPSIVFVNCCHLGTVEPGAEVQARLAAAEGRPALAASVAVQLIRSGTRCVVVAGWAIDDDKAAAFAITFYARMLDGAGFGDAVLAARIAAFEPGIDSNTWGAYQCYGDPDWRLRGPVPAVNAPAAATPFGLVGEAIEAVDQIEQEIGIGLERSAWPSFRCYLEAQRQKLASVTAQAEQQGWLGDPELRASLGRAWGALGDPDAAIDHYQAAIAGARGRAAAVVVEQVNNLRAKRSCRRARAPDIADTAPFIADIAAACLQLETLTLLFGETGERLALQGGCCKRLAQLAQRAGDTDEAAAQLTKMQTLYRRAAALERHPQDQRWAGMMAAMAALCLAELRNLDLVAPLADIEPLAAPDPETGNDYWALTASADAMTLAMIASRRFDTCDWGAIRTRYRTAWQHVGSPLHLASISEQLDACEDLLGHSPGLGPDQQTALAGRLAEIRAELNTLIQGGEHG